MQKYKVHCSGISNIMAKATKDRTISVGAETTIKDWYISNLYARSKPQATSKYTDKGNEKEGDAIRFLSKVHGDFYSKNNQTFENEYLVGTPDIITPDAIIDIKCSWDCFTFPYFETELNKVYWAQMQGYMALTGKKRAVVAYCLMDPTFDQIEYAISDYCKTHNCERTEEIEEKVIAQMSYENLPTNLRLKEFEVLRDEDYIASVYDRVTAMRDFLKALVP